MNELEIAKREAYSLVPGASTVNLRYVGAVRTEHGDINRYYCNDSTREYFFNSVNSEKFDREMREAERKRRCLRRLERYSKKERA